MPALWKGNKSLFCTTEPGYLAMVKTLERERDTEEFSDLQFCLHQFFTSNDGGHLCFIQPMNYCWASQRGVQSNNWNTKQGKWVSFFKYSLQKRTEINLFQFRQHSTNICQLKDGTVLYLKSLLTSEFQYSVIFSNSQKE